jgi:uridine kinase
MRFNEFYQPIEEGVYDPNIFKAVFMAGSPGSGKTTVANNIFAGTGLKSLNVDDFYNHLRNSEKSSGDTEQDYKSAWNTYTQREKNYLDGRLGLIIDGTGKNPNVMSDVKQKLEQLGYETCMVFVNTTLDTSLARTVNRASTPGKDYGRNIDADFVKTTWERVQQSLGKLQSIFGDKFYIVDNNRSEPNLQYVQKTIDKWLQAPPQSHIAKEWMKDELKAKQK